MQEEFDYYLNNMCKELTSSNAEIQGLTPIFSLIPSDLQFSANHSRVFVYSAAIQRSGVRVAERTERFHKTVVLLEISIHHNAKGRTSRMNPEA